MPNIWNFCPSSEPYLERCIAVAPPLDINNKWYQKFGKKNSTIEPPIETKKNPVCNLQNTPPDVRNDTTHEDFFDAIENESHVPIVLEKCAKNPSLVPEMAERISTNAVDQIFKYIFSNKDAEDAYISTFITTFLHPYIKTHYSRQIIDLLTKINEKHPTTFKSLLELLINDTEVHNQVINSYVTALNEESIMNFINILSNVQITSKGFLHNVFSIHAAYKTCIKTNETQNFIQNLLIQHSQSCSLDMNYGKLFVTFLQSEKCMGRTGNKLLEECLEIHSSPFKRPCVVLMKQINK